MKLLALIEHDDHVCYRYRIAAMRSDFAQRGWELKSLALAGGVVPFYRQLAAIAQADAVILQRKLLAWWKLRLLRRAAKRLVFDLDDAVFSRDNNSQRAAHSSSRWRRFQAIVSSADMVTAGNAYLVEQAKRAVANNGAGKIRHVPTVVNPALYPTAKHERRGAAAQLVWIGSRSTMTALDEARPALAAAAQEIGRLPLKVICDAVPTIPEVEVVECRWTETTEATELAAADIGVSWLPEHPWSEGKCGLKVLQYMAAGLPVVANPVAMHKTLVVDGVTGFLAATPAEWSAAIKRLADSADLRQRQFVMRHFSTATWGPRLSQYIDGLLAARVQRAA